MQKSKITTLNLETRTKELRKDNKTEREIARILSDETHHIISQANVHRYFAACVKENRDVVDKTAKLKAKVVEAQIDTISRRNKIIQRLERVADKAEDEGVSKDLLEALKIQITALDSLDKRLGNFAPQKLDIESYIKIVQVPELRRIIKEIDAGQIEGSNSDIIEA